jgi:replicative DNA helicase
MSVYKQHAKKRENSHLVDHELAVMASVLVNPALLDETAAVNLSKEDFQTPAFGSLYERLMNLRLLGSSWSEAEAVRCIQQSGIERQVLSVMLEMGHVYQYDFKFFVKMILEYAKLFKLAKVIDDASQMIADKTATKATLEMLEIGVQQLKADRELRLFDCMALGKMSLAAKDRENPVEAYTGLYEVDDLIGGFHAGDLSVLAARASVGKTAFALQIAESNANRGRPVLFVSLEMDAVDIFDRLIANDTSISISRLRGGRKSLNDSDLNQITESISTFKDLPLMVYAPSKATTADIRSACRIANARDGLSLVIIDYLTFIRHASGRMDRREQVGEILKDLKRLAKDLGVPVMVLSQLNRMAEGEQPTLAMLRESGSVEEDADQVVFVHRESRVANEGKIIVAKNRHGQCGAVDVDWDGRKMRYTVAAVQGLSGPAPKGKPKTKTWTKPNVKPEGEPWTG